MPKLDLSNVEKLLSEATPGPWAVDSVLPYAVSPAICECFGLKVAGKNAALIALAPDLAAEVLRLSNLVHESLFHLRLDERAKAYHDKASAELGISANLSEKQP